MSNLIKQAIEANKEGFLWEVEVKGTWQQAEKGSFEISVVREDFGHGFQSWGWFDERKILVTHSGGHTSCIPQMVFDDAVLSAEKLAERLNRGQN